MNDNENIRTVISAHFYILPDKIDVSFGDTEKEFWLYEYEVENFSVTMYLSDTKNVWVINNEIIIDDLEKIYSVLDKGLNNNRLSFKNLSGKVLYALINTALYQSNEFTDMSKSISGINCFTGSEYVSDSFANCFAVKLFCAEFDETLSISLKDDRIDEVLTYKDYDDVDDYMMDNRDIRVVVLNNSFWSNIPDNY